LIYAKKAAQIIGQLGEIVFVVLIFGKNFTIGMNR
jgi:hypothetical protein